jgi:beta-glucanase (GH16 family)
MRIQALCAGILVTMMLPACKDEAGPVRSSDVHYPAANLLDDTYEPGPGWTLVWSDEFDGEALDEENWNRQVEKAGRFNGEWQRYTDSTENAYVEDGCLVIRAIHESDKHGIDQYTSARLNTANKQAWTYGKIAARIQLPHGKGVWPAFWMLGANIDENGGDTPWPWSGEIDILELYGSRDDGVVEANIHYAGRAGRYASMGAVPYKLDEGRFADNFHVFELEWTGDSLAWFVDGQRFASTPITAGRFSEFHRDFFILLNIAVGGRSARSPDSTTVFPLQMYVDWVRVYQRSP